jgi:hypothetical protein
MLLVLSVLIGFGRLIVAVRRGDGSGALLSLVVGIAVVALLAMVIVGLYNRRVRGLCALVDGGGWAAPCVDPRAQGRWQAVLVDAAGVRMVGRGRGVRQDWRWQSIRAVTVERVPVSLVTRTGVVLHLADGSRAELLLPSRTTLAYPPSRAEQAAGEIRRRLAAFRARPTVPQDSRQGEPGWSYAGIRQVQDTDGQSWTPPVQDTAQIPVPGPMSRQWSGPVDSGIQRPRSRKHVALVASAAAMAMLAPIVLWSYRATVPQDDQPAAAVRPVVAATHGGTKAAASTYLSIVTEWDAAKDSYNRAGARAMAAHAGIPPYLQVAAADFSAASTKEAARLHAYGPWPPSVRLLIDQIITQKLIMAKTSHQMSAITNTDSWNKVMAQSQAADAEGGRLSGLIRAALGLPPRPTAGNSPQLA